MDMHIKPRRLASLFMRTLTITKSKHQGGVATEGATKNNKVEQGVE